MEIEIHIRGDEMEVMETLALALRLSEITRFSDFDAQRDFVWKDDVPLWMKEHCRWQARFILGILKDQHGG